MDSEELAKKAALERIIYTAKGLQKYKIPVSATATATTKIIPRISNEKEEDLKLAREGRHPQGLQYDPKTDTYFMLVPPDLYEEE